MYLGRTESVLEIEHFGRTTIGEKQDFFTFENIIDIVNDIVDDEVIWKDSATPVHHEGRIRLVGNAFMAAMQSDDHVGRSKYSVGYVEVSRVDPKMYAYKIHFIKEVQMRL